MQVILNKKSGGGTAIKKWEHFCKKLNLNERSIITHYIGVNGSEDEFLLDSLNKGNHEFVIAGGDGTVNHFLNQLMRYVEPDILNKVIIGAVGIGSSNDFHKPFQVKSLSGKIPYKLNFKDAVYRDVGCLEFIKGDNFIRKYFLINASIGVAAEGNRFFNSPDFILQFLKKYNTQSAITYAAVKNIFSYNCFKASITIINESFEVEISHLGIIKCPFFSGKLRYLSSPILNNGLFDVHLYQSLSRTELLKLFYSLSYNTSDISFNKKFWRTERIKISSEKEFAVEFDGEIISTTSVEFSVIPRLIRVCIN